MNEFIRRFKERNRTTQCRELLGHDLSTEEGRDAAADQNFFALPRCTGFVRDAEEILDGIAL